MQKYFSYLFLFCMLLLCSCNVGNRKYYQEKSQPIPVSIQRFDKALLSMDTANVNLAIRKLYLDYPTFMPAFVEDVLGISTYDTAYLASLLPAFLSDTLFAKVNRKEQEVFADVSDIELEIGMAFARLKTFYSEIQIPQIYFFVSGFNNSFLMRDNEFAIGADMYLGNDYKYYEGVVYNYMRYTMRPECIPLDVVSAYLFRNFEFNLLQNRLLENMIYRGRIMYFLSVLFPNEQSAEIMGYTAEQWKWCTENERPIWTAVLDQKDLFKTDGMTLTKYLNDAPFTAPISDQSPGRLGTWIGWRIVESYMENNREITMQDLLSEQNAQKILELSKYKP